jgi:putative iron-dependent peroxidase
MRVLLSLLHSAHRIRGIGSLDPDGNLMQSGESQAILTPITEAAVFLTLTVDSGGEETVREFLSDVSGLTRSVGFRIPEAQLTCVVGIGAALWDRMFAKPRPLSLHPFREFNGSPHRAPATPGDLLFHIRAHRLDMAFELAQLLTGRLIPRCAQVVDEVHGFRSFDERDPMGFVDGTENPQGQAARAAVLIDEEDPNFPGGSYVLVQKYLHDLQAWNSLSIEEQERAFGRMKLDDVEFPDELKPSNSHLTLNTIVDEQGEQQQIMRFNMPFGRVGAEEFGTYYIGYARSPDVIEQMLENMFIGKPPGNYDRILDFSTALTGNLFFVPTVELLDDPPPPGSAAPAAAPGEEESGSGDGSLAIGSLRGGGAGTRTAADTS